MAELTRPRRLCRGDAIGLVSTSNAPAPQAVEDGLDVLRRWGFDPVLAPHALDRWGHMAGPDAARAEDFNLMWADPDIKAIICTTGGYGGARLLPRLDWELVRRTPKFFCGFSDIIAFHLGLAREAQLVTFHGPNLIGLGGQRAVAYNERALLRAMTSTDPLGTIEWPDSEGAPVPRCIAPGRARGRLLGGCSSMVASMIGTRWAMKLEGALLVLEDVNETPARLDKVLGQLWLSGLLERAAGIVFGYSPTCERAPAETPQLDLFEILQDRLRPLGIPVVYGFPIGHDRYNATLPFGALAELDAESGSLTVLEPALSD